MPIELERFREHDWPVEDLPPASVRTVRDEGVWRGVVAHQRWYAERRRWCEANGVDWRELGRRKWAERIYRLGTR
ncbi:MAG TPA: hypothetical protein VIR30_02740 [Nocardioides sp.]